MGIQLSGCTKNDIGELSINNTRPNKELNKSIKFTALVHLDRALKKKGLSSIGHL